MSQLYSLWVHAFRPQQKPLGTLQSRVKSWREDPGGSPPQAQLRRHNTACRGIYTLRRLPLDRPCTTRLPQLSFERYELELRLCSMRRNLDS